MNAPQALATIAPAQSAGFDLSPRNFEQAWQFAEIMSDSDMVPKDFKGKPGNCLIAMQWGSELGLKAMQSVQNIAVINGRPALWGDSVIALVRSSPLCEWIIESDDGNTATCRVKRRGEPEQSRTFSVEDAQAAGLKGKQGPWTQYPKRMRQMRARAFALRDVFPDVLRGLPVAEEVMDAPPAERYMGQAEEVKPATQARPELPAYADADFAKNLPAWTKVVESGKKTAADLLAMLATKATFTDAQRATVLGLGAKPDPKPEPAADKSATDEWVDDMEAAEGAAK